MPRKIHVFCLTYGEPAENVFGAQYEYSLSILNRLTRRVAPIPKFITPLLAARRARNRVADLNEEGFNSPLERHSKDQVAALAEALRRRDPANEYTVELVYEFRPPYIWEFLDKIKRNPPDEIIMLPLYVADSDFTSGVSRTDLENYHKQNVPHVLPVPRYIEGFGFDERLGKVMADFVWQYCVDNGWDETKTRDAVLIMGAHGTLVHPPPGVNSGWKETCHLYGMIRKHLKDKFASVRVGWLNHTLGGKWTFPEVVEAAHEAQQSGIKKVVYYPFGFVADNGESILEGKGQLDELEWEEMLYLPCMNDDARYIDYLAERVVERLDQPAEKWNTIGRVDPSLAKKEPPAVRVEPGFLKFNSGTLAGLAFLFWLVIGVWLTARGFLYTMQVSSPLPFIFAWVFGIVVGYYKGSRILGKMALKNLARLRTLPQPSPVHKLFSKSSWIIIVFFACVGMALRFIPLTDFVRGSILNAVGLAMVFGAVYYVANREKAQPRQIVPLSRFRTRSIGGG